MSITSFLKDLPKRYYAIAAMLLAVVAVPAMVNAWGPSRTTYTIEHPADHVTFNSITNNPVQGDERNFMQVREANASNTTYADSISLQAGHEYVVYMYYHNNAASNLNASGVGIAHGAYVKAQIPAVVANGSSDTKAVGYVGANNASPSQVWDDISFSNKTGGDIALRYVPGSATIHNFGKTDGKTMSDGIVTAAGASLGYDSFNGELPGCNEYAGYVTFLVKADQPNFTVTKQVRKTGTTDWKTSTSVNPGDSVDYMITYKNTGTTQQNDVVLKDVLPKGISYTAGTTMVANSTNPNGIKVSDNLTKNGINIGNYAAGATAYVKFSAKVASNDDLTNCGLNTLVNTVTAETNNGSKSASATVTVNKTCEQPKKITVCDLSTNKIVTINEQDFDSKKYSKNLDDCAVITVKVCDLKTKQITTIDQKDFDSSKYSKNLNDCKTTPKTPELPHTGIADGISAVFGVGALAASTMYYVASRRGN